MNSTGISGLKLTDISPVGTPAIARPERNDPERSKDRHKTKQRRPVYDAKPFIAWDGEGWTDNDGKHHYCLFGASSGESISDDSLSTVGCLDLLLRVSRSHKESIHIGFSFEYDVNMILRDMEPPFLRKLKKDTFVHWRGYRIEHIPKKWFMVSKDNVTCKVQDVFSYFACSFVKALKGWSIGTEEEVARISAGKDQRGVFRIDELDTLIRPYWKEELVLLVSLAERLREILYQSGIRITQWYGPGTVASFLYKQNGTEAHMDQKLDPRIREASSYAYVGGRFEAFRVGLYLGTVYSADINSAYPYAMSRMPSLTHGQWHHLSSEYAKRAVRTLVRPEAEALSSRNLGMFKVRVSLGGQTSIAATLRSFPLPVPCRMKHGGVCWPRATTTWVHAPEAAVLAALYPKEVEWLEAWVYEDEERYPFDWVSDMYQTRLALKAKRDPAEKAIKLGINSLYGKLAQRIGWNEETGEAPKWHQLEWAGHITSTARAMLHLAALPAAKDGGLIAVETDGVYSTTPFGFLPVGVGDALGQWKVETYTGILYLQSGVYWLRDGCGNWLPPKSRGIPQSHMDRASALDALSGGRDFVAKNTQFIGYGQACHRNNFAQWRRWIDTEKSFQFGGNGKRFHAARRCMACRAGATLAEGLHNLAPHWGQEFSEKHTIPWEGWYNGDSILKEKGMEDDRHGPIYLS